MPTLFYVVIEYVLQVAWDIVLWCVRAFVKVRLFEKSQTTDLDYVYIDIGSVLVTIRLDLSKYILKRLLNCHICVRSRCK
jgi:hypothetical protein